MDPLEAWKRSTDCGTPRELMSSAIVGEKKRGIRRAMTSRGAAAWPTGRQEGVVVLVVVVVVVAAIYSGNDKDNVWGGDRYRPTSLTAVHIDRY
jgi:predicted metalloprotease